MRMNLETKAAAPPARSDKATFGQGIAEPGGKPGELRLGRQKKAAGLSGDLVLRAVLDSFRKLDPRTLARNPVMFVVEIVAVLTTILVIRDIVTGAGGIAFSAQITFWLWFTVVFANFAEAVAEGRGKAQADNLRRMRTETQAKRLRRPSDLNYEKVSALDLAPGDIVLVEAGDSAGNSSSVLSAGPS